MNKIIVTCSVIIILLLVLVPSVYKVYKNHEDNLIKVTEQRIIEAAIKCKKESICTEESITLEMLYENNYLEKESDPVTKEYYNELSYVVEEDNDYKFVVK